MTKDNISAYNNSLTPEERSERSREAGKASGKARSENRKIRERLLESMTDDDWNEIIDGAIKRAKGEDRAFVILRDTLGEKPTNKQSFEDEEVTIRVHVVDPETGEEIDPKELGYKGEDNQK